MTKPRVVLKFRKGNLSTHKPRNSQSTERGIWKRIKDDPDTYIPESMIEHGIFRRTRLRFKKIMDMFKKMEEEEYDGEAEKIPGLFN